MVSLTERREQKQREQAADASAPSAAATNDGETEVGEPERKHGRLFWLYCPTCRNLEYTELAVPGGRIHTPCGTRVQEAVVDMDLRAEYTIAHLNLERLRLLEGLIQQQRARFVEYQSRLNLAAGESILPYALEDKTLARLDVVETDGLGLLVSRFFSDSSRHFPELEALLNAENPSTDKED